MMRPLVILLNAMVVLAVGGCAGNDKSGVQWTPLPSRSVGQQAGDTIETLPSVIGERPVAVVSVVRTFAEDGMLAVCGAVVAVGPKAQLPEVSAFIGDRKSELVIGIRAAQPVRVAPSMLRLHTRVSESAEGFDPKSLDFSTLEGECIKSDRLWSPDYQSSNRLNLRKTVYKQGAPSTVYVPPARRR